MSVKEDGKAVEVLQRCGEHSELVLNCLLANLPDFTPVIASTENIVDSQKDAYFALLMSPMLQLLQSDGGECACSPIGRLVELSASQSGSQLDGFASWHFGQPTSDCDIMHELGPVRWAVASDAAPDGVAAQLTSVATRNSGFVTLLQVPRPGCRHSRPLTLSAARVRRLLHDCFSVAVPDHVNTVTGPASTIAGFSHPVPGHDRRPADEPAKTLDFDHVPCLRAPWLAADEFFVRSRRSGWPPPAVLEDIRRFGMHLVPVGCKGSVTEESEWRMSFSRAETMVAWLLTPVQRKAVICFKACQKLLVPPGSTVKSYFVKTALLWLRQQTTSDCWVGVTHGVRRIIDFLEAALAARRLPCFFWTSIDLLRYVTPEEVEAMQRTIGALRRDLTRLTMSVCAVKMQPMVSCLMHGAPGQLSERELRARLTRRLMVHGVHLALIMVDLPLVRQQMRHYIPELLRMSAATELRRYHRALTRNNTVVLVQVVLFRALLTAPSDVAARVTATCDDWHVLCWDPTPLLQLLTAADVESLLLDSAAVSAWCGTRLAADRRRLARLVLDVPRLASALDNSVPDWRAVVKASSGIGVTFYHLRRSVPTFETFQTAQLQISRMRFHLGVSANELQARLGLDLPTARRMAAQLRQIELRQWHDPATRARHNTIITSVHDSWQLRQFAREFV